MTHIRMGEVSSSVTVWGVQLHTYGGERSAKLGDGVGCTITHYGGERSAVR